MSVVAGVMVAVTAAGMEETNMSVRTATDSVTWVLDNTQAIGGVKVETQGNPQVSDTDKGKAILFNGESQAIFLGANPLKGAATFTLEALFRPEAGGLKEQRFVHVQENGSESRVLLETRLTGPSWYGDTYIKTGAGDLALADPALLHSLGRWHALAVVFDGTNMIQYVDGKRELTGALKFLPLGDARVSIGCRINQICWFKGAVREVRFSRCALAPEQLLEP